MRPDYYPQIDKANPLLDQCKMLAIIGPNNIGYDLINDVIASEDAGTVSWEVGAEGHQLDAATASGSIRFDIDHGINAGPLTVMVRGMWDGTSANWQTVISLDNNFGIYAPRGSTGVYANDTLQASTVNLSGTGAVVQDVWQTYTITCTGSTDSSGMIGYIDGIQTGSGTQTYAHAGTHYVLIGRGQTSEYCNHRISWAAVWSRALTAEEVLYAQRIFDYVTIKTGPETYYPTLGAAPATGSSFLTLLGAG